MSSPKAPSRAASHIQPTPTSWRYSLRFRYGALSEDPIARRPLPVIAAAAGLTVEDRVQTREARASWSRLSRRAAVPLADPEEQRDLGDDQDPVLGQRAEHREISFRQ